uniref:Probable serine/threonine-protein kinase mps1 n=1 Tax=Dermatophagoides pteronyssinus TaxID=6956 RepID=A0A6P6YH70_DERPT|nr:probable serine/threonine-protein kinase mps1 [Dermatophagoides pteronyssinus]
MDLIIRLLLIITMIISSDYGGVYGGGGRHQHLNHFSSTSTGNPITITPTTTTATPALPSTTESLPSLSSKQQQNLNAFIKNFNPFNYSNGGKMKLLSMNLIRPQQQKLEQETDNNHPSIVQQFDTIDDIDNCLAGSLSSSISTTPTPPEQQLEQFIQSLKPQNMDAIVDDNNGQHDHQDGKNADIMNTGDDDLQQQHQQDFDLIDPIKHEKLIDNDHFIEQQQQQNLSTESTKTDNNKNGHRRGQQPKRFKAAVLTRYSMEYRPIDSNLLTEHELEGIDDSGDERIIDIIPQSRPLQLHFKSPSNRIRVIQSSIEDHEKQTEKQEIERTEEEPRLYYQQIRKPILQQVHEIIMPYRKVIQEIKPVVEQIHTVVSSKRRSPSSSGKFHKSNPIIDQSSMNKFNRSPIARFKQIQQQQQQQPERLSSSKTNDSSLSSTLSPLLIGVEQVVDPNIDQKQQQQHNQLMMQELLKILPTNHHHQGSTSPSLSHSSLIDGQSFNNHHQGGHYGSRQSSLSSMNKIGGIKSV